MNYVVGVDIGGTFTDLVALDEASGRIHLLKVRTTSEDPSTGFIEGVDEIRARSAQDLANQAAYASEPGGTPAPLPATTARGSAPRRPLAHEPTCIPRRRR